MEIGSPLIATCFHLRYITMKDRLSLIQLCLQQEFKRKAIITLAVFGQLFGSVLFYVVHLPSVSLLIIA